MGVLASSHFKHVSYVAASDEYPYSMSINDSFGKRRVAVSDHIAGFWFPKFVFGSRWIQT